jgi:tripartite-type tricarboxylate transporter receptor subunit TctC
MNHEVSICASWETSGITRFDDLLTKELLVGAVSNNDDTGQFAKVMNTVLGTKLKIVAGYPGGNDVVLAMERGEVQGRCGWSWSSVLAAHMSWWKEKKINILVQLALAKHPDLPDVPLITDLAKNDAQRQMLRMIFARQVMGRPFVAPPGVPQERVAALRKAFMETLADKEFLADSAKAKLEIAPVPGDRVEALVKDIYATPASVAKQAAAALK